MASMRDIKHRKNSIQSTGQITKAMKLVSTVKLQRAKEHAEESKPYFKYLYETMQTILQLSSNVTGAMFTGEEKEQATKKACIVITSNRGLAGGYNSNVVKLLAENGFDNKDSVIYAIGRKGKEALARKGYEIKADYSDVINEPLYKDAMQIGRDVMSAFEQGEVGEIHLFYTVFKNTVTHIPTAIKLLPFLTDEDGQGENKGGEDSAMDKLLLMNYEPEPEFVLERILPKYVNGLIYGALIESQAAENGARMQAMDNATNNAEDMISELELKYNRARQGSITQELTEIVAGASAIE